jgi:hypothetical protein
MRVTGVWAGALFSTIMGMISQSFTAEKWKRGQDSVDSVLDAIDENDGIVDYKLLERVRGFLCHLSMTFEVITPFLKGFHLILAKHLRRRDKDGWKFSEKRYLSYVHQKLADDEITEAEAELMLKEADDESPDAPKTLQAIQRLIQDCLALRSILSPATPPDVLIRSSMIFQILYGFGDASGKGFGSTLLSNKGVKARIGLWEPVVEDESSNWKEFENVVEALEEEGRHSALDSCLAYFFTDNSTAEAALYKGNSSSPKLFDLVVRFKKLETHHKA